MQLYCVDMVGVGVDPNVDACCDDTFQYNSASVFGFALSLTNVASFSTENETPQNRVRQFK